MAHKTYKKDSESLRFASLSHYKWHRKVSVYFIDLFLYCFISLIGKTIRFETSDKTAHHPGWKAMERFTDEKPPCVAIFWHDRIILTTYFWRFSNFAAMVSQSFDGEYVARISQRFGHGIARGSSTRGGTNALRKMIRLLKKEKFSLTLTIDGPKGPRYEIKTGALLLAKTTGVPLVPILIEPRNFWSLRTWDRIQIPKPFTTAKVFVGDPITIPGDSSAEDLENYRKEVQGKLDELVFLGKQWRHSKK